MIKLVDASSWRGYRGVSALDWEPVEEDCYPTDDTAASTLTTPDFKSLEQRGTVSRADEYPWDEGRQTDSKPLVLIDFDGVLNAFPDEKLLRRGGQAGGWLDQMAADDPRKQLYSLDHAFLLDKSERVTICQSNEYGGSEKTTVRIRWASKLADSIRKLQADCEADVAWLSTWQPFTRKLEFELGLIGSDATEPLLSTILWYDPVTGLNRGMGKLHSVAAILQELQAAGQQRPVVWIDDEEADEPAEKWLRSHGLGEVTPLLMVQPDDRIGVNRGQWKHITEFISGRSGETEPGIYSDRTPRLHEGHFGW